MERLRTRFSAGEGPGDFLSRNRPDALAWMSLFYGGAGENPEGALRCKQALTSFQHADGRVAFPQTPKGFWPTSDAILAWHGDGAFEAQKERAVHFLLKTTGSHHARGKERIVEHDTSIRGWPWVEKTHSWVEPTSMALLALELAGKGDHPRAVEGRAMLMDRQLPSGGWNVGNTKVYGTELRPSPECTALALHALAGKVAPQDVEKSLDYALRIAGRTRAPLSLAWLILALSAWGRRPEASEDRIRESLDFERHTGGYDPTWICLLAMAAHCGAGLMEALR